jgi:hypothetical protein
MLEESMGDPLKSTCRTIALNPNKHFAEMDHFMFDDALHRGQPIGAFYSTDSGSIPFSSKRLKQKVGRKGDFEAYACILSR